MTCVSGLLSYRWVVSVESFDLTWKASDVVSCGSKRLFIFLFRIQFQ